MVEDADILTYEAELTDLQTSHDSSPSNSRYAITIWEAMYIVQYENLTAV